MPPTAIPFPGQGSQTDDMRATVERFRSELDVIEVGPGRVFSGSAKRTLADVELVHA